MSFEELLAKIMTLPPDQRARLLDFLQLSVPQVHEAQPVSYVAHKGSSQQEVSSMPSISERALQLSAAERAELAYQLLQSLDSVSVAEIDEEWLDEAQRRAAQIDRGEVTLIPGEEVARKARALLKK